jgi:hypothetical protein
MSKSTIMSKSKSKGINFHVQVKKGGMIVSAQVKKKSFGAVYNINIMS